MDQTLVRFVGNAVKLVVIVSVAIITPDNFGISMALFGCPGQSRHLVGPISKLAKA